MQFLFYLRKKIKPLNYLFRYFIVGEFVFREDRVGHDEQVVVGRRVRERGYVVERQVRDRFAVVHIFVEVDVVVGDRGVGFGPRRRARVSDAGRCWWRAVVFSRGRRPLVRRRRFQRQNYHRGMMIDAVVTVFGGPLALRSRRDRSDQVGWPGRRELRVGGTLAVDGDHRLRGRGHRRRVVVVAAAKTRQRLPELGDLDLLLPNHRVPLAQLPSDLLLFLPQPRFEHVQ